MLLKHSYHHPMSSFHCLFILLCSSLSSGHARCVQSDQHSLLSSFSPPLSTVVNWSSVDCCQWEGIACDPNGRISRLWLPSRGLRAGISSSITNLTRLSHLNLSRNSLIGSLPNDLFSSLNRLEVLDLSHNTLQGELPASSSSNFSISIKSMDLSNNRFRGLIPPSLLREANNLIYFNVSGNIFTGTIPSSLCTESSSARLLDFSLNGFSGEIPGGIGDCLQLEVLRMGFNSLSGMIPNGIYHIPTLREVSLASNRLHGPIHADVANLTNLITLDVHSNELSGILPWEIGELSKLEKLILDVNHLNSTIPTSLMNCTHLSELRLGYNFFHGDLYSQNFSKLVNLRKLDLCHNFFSGKFPMSIYSCKALRAIRLATNKLEGQITSHMLDLKSLSFLSLSDIGLTNITGAMRILVGCKNLKVLFLAKNFIGEVMPDNIDIQTIVGLSGFQNLRIFGIPGCRLSGEVPTWLKHLRNLQFLSMADNQLRGSIPDWLGTLPSLFYIDLSNNLLAGAIPDTLYRLKALTSEYFVAKSDRSTFELTIFLASNKTDLRNPQAGHYNSLSDLPSAILLKHNNLHSNIMGEIGRLKHLQLLDLSNNHLSGGIPNEISKLSSLESLILSRNQLSGEIPASLTGLNFLRQFNVSFNDLQGQIPTGTQLQSFGASAYEGNRKLCGPPLPNRCEADAINESGGDMREDDMNNDETSWFDPISTGVGFISGFSTVCCILLLSRSWRHAYFQFLNNIKDRLCVTVEICISRIGRRY